MRILIESPNCNPTGGSNAVVGAGWVRGLAARGHEVHVVVSAARYDEGHPGGRAPDIPGVTAIRIPPSATRKLGTLVDYTAVVRRRRRRILDEVRPDVVHSIEPGGWLGPRALATSRVPYVLGPLNGGGALAPRAFIEATFAGLPVSPARALVRVGPRKLAVRLVNEALFGDIPTARLLARRSMRKARRILLATDLSPGAIPRGVQGRVRRLPLTGLDLQAFRPIDGRAPKPFTILFAGRLQALKGLHLLIEALPSTDAMLRIAGAATDEDAWYEQHCRARAGSVGVADRVHWLGALDRATLAREYAAADVFCMPSVWESFGMAYVEAMACGTPVVALASGGATSVVAPGTGWLVEASTPADAIEELAAVLDRLRGDPDEVRHAGEAARAHVERTYAWDRVLAALDAIYDEVV